MSKKKEIVVGSKVESTFVSWSGRVVVVNPPVPTESDGYLIKLDVQDGSQGFSLDTSNEAVKFYESNPLEVALDRGTFYANISKETTKLVKD